MIERKTELEEKDHQPAKLSDLAEGVVLPTEKSGKKRRRRALPAVLAMLFLVGIAGIGGYFLLRGNRVYLKANKRLEEKTASGADIRKAAYDSISDSLTPPSATAPSAGAAIKGPSEIAVSGANQSKPPFPEITSGEKGAAPAEPGIAATLAPPTETYAAKPSPPAETREERSGPTSSNVASTLPAISAISRSVRFASVIERERSAKTELKPQAERQDSEGHRLMDQSSYRTAKQERSGRRSNLPSFGAMLPVRLMGALYTLRTGSIARFELTRDLKADHWRMRRGTIFIGNVIGGDLARAYLHVKGYIDPDTERLVKIEGELLGDDGGAGLRGKQRRVSPVWAKVLDRAAQAGVQIATGVLNSRASSVIIATDPYGTIRSPNESQSNNIRSFVEVPAGAVGFVMVTTLPASDEADPHLAAGEQTKNEFADQELADLITSADPARIRAALQRMNPELRQIAQMTLKELEGAGK